MTRNLWCWFLFGMSLLCLLLIAKPARAGNPGTYVNQAAAQTACNEWGEMWVNVFATDSIPDQHATYTCEIVPLDLTFQFTLTGHPGGTLRADGFTWKPGGDCPPGFGADPSNPTECLTPEKCTSKNDALGSAITTTDTDTHGCYGGCAMSMGTNYETITINGHTVFRGMMRYTGAACATSPTKPPNDPSPECAQAGTLTMCVRPDGNHCASASTGRQVCWQPGETGEKNDGPVKQVRQAGTEHTPPNVQLPNGDTLTQTGGPVVTQQTGGLPGKPTQNITTNITNYTTNNGTNAGPGNDGQNSDGSDDGEGEEGDDKDGPKLTGGTDCNVPPVCDVVDDAMCKSGIITWKFQCDGAAEAGSAQAEAQTAVDLLNATWDEEAQQFSDGAVQRYNEMRSTLASEAISVDSNDGFDALDASGFLGGGQCPQLPSLSVGAANINFDFAPICALFGNLGLLVEALAYFVALRILTAP
ncbi:hypothetical protein [Lysobacter sp.]|uniref:hypothetical protein n=1 Tax=Lysobacter sp. TaxID=72226 RepID=UPI002D353712|nr:hypothetical protein [Lysobacter sp.]HZX76821.1 hypothetical protein [Lysobacter sp.]